MATRRKMTRISREVLEATARIIGPSSAAARALADADSHDGQTYFFQFGATIVVKKIPANMTN